MPEINDNININIPNGNNHMGDALERLLRRGGTGQTGGGTSASGNLASNRIALMRERNTNTNTGTGGANNGVGENNSNNSNTYSYLWGTAEDNNSIGITQTIQDQNFKLNQATEFYTTKQQELTDWLYNSGVVRDMTDANVIANREAILAAIDSKNFYIKEQEFNQRIQDALATITLDPQMINKFVGLYDQLDNLRDNFDKFLQPGKQGDTYGTEGFIAKLELEKAKFLTEDVILKGGTVEDVDRFSKTFDDQIQAAKNAMAATAAGKPEEAAMWDFISGKIKTLRDDGLTSLFMQSTADNADQNQIVLGNQLFDNSYTTLTTRIENSMLTAINNGSSFTDLINVKANPDDVKTIREEFNSIYDNVMAYAENTKSLEQIMEENSMDVLDYDRDHNISNQEVAGAIMDIVKAKNDFQNAQIYNHNFDIDNDGDIDQTDEDYLKSIAIKNNSLFSLVNKAMTTVDTNNDGQVSLDEAHAALASYQDALANKAHLDATQILMDLDGNGTISTADFNLILDVINRKSRLGDKITGLNTASNSMIDTVLKSLNSNQSNLTEAINSMNTALDNFDAAAGDLMARTAYNRDFNYYRWAKDLAVNRQTNDAWQATFIVSYPNKLIGREDEYAQRIALLDTSYDAMHDSIMGEKDYWRDIRIKAQEYYQQSAATMLITRGASTTDIARSDKLYDFYQELDAEATNYRYGYNIDLGNLVTQVSGPLNPNKVKSTVLADFAAQDFVQIGRLIQTQAANINKLDASESATFEQNFATLMNLHNQAEQLLLDNLSSGITLTDPRYTAIRDQFDATVTLLTNLFA